MVRILGIDRINITHANVSPNISEETTCALRDMLAKAYVFKETVHPSPQSDAYTEGDVYKAIDRLGIGGSDIARDLMYNLRNPKS